MTLSTPPMRQKRMIQTSVLTYSPFNPYQSPGRAANQIMVAIRPVTPSRRYE